MFKIELSDEIKESHKKYFEEKIVKKLQNTKISFLISDIRKINKEYGKKYTKYNIQKEHDDFIQYCINSKDKISIGKVEELKIVMDEISRSYPIVTYLINEKFEFSKTNKYKGKKYWEVLFDLFGYKEFCNCSLFTVIRDLAKHNLSIDDLSVYSDRKSVQIEMRCILEQLFPKIKDKVNDDSNFVKKNSRGSKVILNMNEFEDKLKEFQKNIF